MGSIKGHFYLLKMFAGVLAVLTVSVNSAQAGLEVQPIEGYVECTWSGDKIMDLFGKMYSCEIEYCTHWHDDGNVTDFFKLGICTPIKQPDPYLDLYDNFANVDPDANTPAIGLSEPAPLETFDPTVDTDVEEGNS